MTRIAIGMVIDERDAKYFTQASRLVRSLHRVFCSVPNVHIFACFLGVGSCSAKQSLKTFGAEPVDLCQLPLEHGPSNKLRFLELVDLRSYDIVGLLDCDIFVERPFSDELIVGAFQAKIADIETVSLTTLVSILQKRGIGTPPAEYRTSVSGARTVMYCNSGVLFIPANAAPAFASHWLTEINSLYSEAWLLDRRNNYGQRERSFCDQIALTVLHYKGLLPTFRPLDNSMNFPVHLMPVPRDTLPYILHYHFDHVWKTLRLECFNSDGSISKQRKK